MVITMFILIWILGLVFLYYQRYVTTVVTNDAALKIASTYNNPTSDIIMGYVTTEDISNRDLYRGFTVYHTIKYNLLASVRNNRCYFYALLEVRF